jgi:hypothetical protein
MEKNTDIENNYKYVWTNFGWIWRYIYRWKRKLLLGAKEMTYAKIKI